jgi:mRNA-degrading endonuclease RelE of RelBE toxin-antitoxin system
MAGLFRVLTTPAFEREFRAISKKDPALLRALEELIGILSEDPHNRSRRHKIKKLAGVKSGEGQWRVRWKDYRLRYDIFGSEIVLHPSGTERTRIKNRVLCSEKDQSSGLFAEECVDLSAGLGSAKLIGSG